MKHRLFNFASAVISLLLCVATAGLWLDSFRGEYFPPGFLGFKWHPSPVTPYLGSLCLFFGAMGIAFSWLVFRSERERRRQRLFGRCRVCGYDLRASVERCPECGTPIPQKAEATG